jgi:transglutaminase-like putative cysteine protease
MVLIYDSVAPTVEAVSDIFVYVGEAIAYRSAIKTSDNCVGNVELLVDDSLVNTAEEGEYEARIVAVDAVGNKSVATKLNVHVLTRDDVRGELDEKIASAVDKIIDDEMTTEQKCRAVYDYVYNNISYVSTSDKTMWQRAAYDALFVSGSGDCYSYFAAAKAFLEYLGIENLDIQRTPGYTADTHYWSLVNIGSESEPRWYHFDCTRLRADYNHSGCLLTLKQTEAYNKVRDSFYRYDKKSYPEVATEIITPTPALEEYYD